MQLGNWEFFRFQDPDCRREIQPLKAILKFPNPKFQNTYLNRQDSFIKKGCLIDFLTLLLIKAPLQKSVNE